MSDRQSSVSFFWSHPTPKNLHPEATPKSGTDFLNAAVENWYNEFWAFQGAFDRAHDALCSERLSTCRDCTLEWQFGWIVVSGCAGHRGVGGHEYSRVLLQKLERGADFLTRSKASSLAVVVTHHWQPPGWFVHSRKCGSSIRCSLFYWLVTWPRVVPCIVTLAMRIELHTEAWKRSVQAWTPTRSRQRLLISIGSWQLAHSSTWRATICWFS